MKTLKNIVGENLTELRKNAHLTQFELAEKMNYSDKSISKWENGDTLPDLETLNELCKFYGVTLDYLTHPVGENKSEFVLDDKNDFINKIMIVSLIVSVVWMLATIAFVYTLLETNLVYWQVFVYAVPLSALIGSYFVKKYFRATRLVYFILWTIFIWSAITSFVVALIPKVIVWPLYLLGIPTQVSLSLWAFIKKKQKRV